MVRRRLLRATVLAVAAGVFTLPAVSVSAVDAAGSPATITADAVTTASFVYVGTTTVGTTTALEFQLADATLTSFVEAGPCGPGAAGVSVAVHVTATGDATLAGPVDLIVTSLNYDGLAEPWTVAHPPAAGALTGPFSHVTASALLVTASAATAAPHVTGQIC